VPEIPTRTRCLPVNKGHHYWVSLRQSDISASRCQGSDPGECHCSREFSWRLSRTGSLIRCLKWRRWWDQVLKLWEIESKNSDRDIEAVTQIDQRVSSTRMQRDERLVFSHGNTQITEWVCMCLTRPQIYSALIDSNSPDLSQLKRHVGSRGFSLAEPHPRMVGTVTPG